MLNINEIKELIKVIEQSSIEKFELEHGGTKVVIDKSNVHSLQPGANIVTDHFSKTASSLAATPDVKHAADKDEPAAELKKDDIHQVLAPMVGTFYSRPNPDTAPFVEVGTKVQKDTVICILEAMKLFNEIEAEVSGEIVEILVEEGQLVEYGQPLFAIKKA